MSPYSPISARTLELVRKVAAACNAAEVERNAWQAIRLLTEIECAPHRTENWNSRQRADFGMKMAEEFALKNGRLLPEDDVEFAGMLAIAFGLGQESRDG